ncbi:KTSC domain-containing protein [Sediminitomix flava]|uniref:KTSC domain-containing protein n=1 Tax=Sediminitomix flava TaxID=379075 RepID=A0A315Z8U3_SEDFL|nr:KTSC domain-containing protein [Sediminitomix flava]PWJ41996.1 KTSC domain-containing protein [Sediminitomix flava]
MVKEVLKEKIVIENSSLIEFLIYDYEAEFLEVKYKRGKHKGKIRGYESITLQDYKEIINSESVGRQLLRTLSHRQKEESSFLENFKNIFSNKSNTPY